MCNLHRLFRSLLILLVASSVALGQSHKPRVRPSELVCKMQPDYGIEIINAEYGTTTRSQQTQTYCYLLTAPPGVDEETLAAQINADPRVQYCGANYLLAAPEGLQRSSPFVDNQFTGRIDTQKIVQALALPATQLLATGAATAVAVIDGGIDATHPYFGTGLANIALHSDYIDGDSLPIDEPFGSMSGHGTFVAGIIRLVAPEATLHIYRALDTSGLGDGFSIASAVLAAVQDSCRIINLSLGMTGMHDGLDDALKYASQHGVLIVAAAGNDSTDLGVLFPFPASRTYCLAVAALDSLDVKADFSNYGVKVTVSAPGVDIYAPYADSLYAWWSGTSFAAPIVSGLAALVASANPAVSNDHIDSLLCRTAVNVDAQNPQYIGGLGAGRIDPLAAVQAALVSPQQGDVNSDLTIDLSDLMMVADYLFYSVGLGSNMPLADCDCDNSVDIADLCYLVDFIFFSLPIPCGL